MYMKLFFLVRPSTEPALSSSQRTGPHARACCGRRANRVEHHRGSNEPRRRVRQRPEQLRRERERDHATHSIRSVSLSPVALSRKVDIANPIVLFIVLFRPLDFRFGLFLVFPDETDQDNFSSCSSFSSSSVPSMGPSVRSSLNRSRERTNAVISVRSSRRSTRQAHCEENERQKANL